MLRTACTTLDSDGNQTKKNCTCTQTMQLQKQGLPNLKCLKSCGDITVCNENEFQCVLVLMSYHHERQLSHAWQYKTWQYKTSSPWQIFHFPEHELHQAHSACLYQVEKSCKPTDSPRGERRLRSHCHPLGTLGPPREDKGSVGGYMAVAASFLHRLLS